jgi:Uma2 family endonuclease
VSPAPIYDHQFVVWQLARLLGNLVIEKNLGVILLSPFDIRLPMRIGDPVQPDLAFVRAERVPRSGDRYFSGAPDLVIEVLSPGTRRYDRTIKLDAYRDVGVPEVWLLDPKPRTVQVYVLSADGKEYVERETRGPGEMATSSVLPDLRLEVSALFPR